MRIPSRLAVLFIGLLGISCGFTSYQACAGRTPCWRQLTPVQLEARHYQHIVVITDVLDDPSTRGETGHTAEAYAFRTSLAIGLSPESLIVLHPRATISFDSAYHQNPDLWTPDAGVAQTIVPDRAWWKYWPSADAILEIRQDFHKEPYCFDPANCEPRNYSCCWLDLYMWDVQTDSAVWIKFENLADVRLPQGQQVLGSWIGPATVKLLQDARIIE